MEQQLVSVIIPIYNVAEYLKKCLDNIINQTYKNLEIICVNDGSTDNSLAILQEYTDKRITIINQKNQGLSEARNVGYRYSNGEFIYFMDSDDYIDLDTIEKAVHEMNKRNLDVLMFNGTVFKDDNDNSDQILKRFKFDEDYFHRKFDYPLVYKGEKLITKLFENKDYMCPVMLFFIRESYLDRINAFFIENIIYEDECYTFKVLLNCDKIGFVNNKFYHRRIRSNAITTSKLLFKNSFSSFINFLDMIKTFKNYTLTKDFDYSVIMAGISRMINISRKQFINLSDKEKSKFFNIENPLYKILYKNLVIDYFYKIEN